MSMRLAASLVHCQAITQDSLVLVDGLCKSRRRERPQVRLEMRVCPDLCSFSRNLNVHRWYNLIINLSVGSSIIVQVNFAIDSRVRTIYDFALLLPPAPSVYWMFPSSLSRCRSVLINRNVRPKQWRRTENRSAPTATVNSVMWHPATLWLWVCVFSCYPC